MTSNRRAFHRHARAVVDHELRRVRGRLATLPPEERLAVEEVSARVAAALVDDVLDRARADPILARALASIYGPEPEWQPGAVSWAPD